MHAIHRTRRSTLTALVGLTAAAALMTAAPSQALGRYTDAAGDAQGAPDITGIQVASDSNGQILFTISAAGLQRGAMMATFLAIDADVNPATGNSSWVGSEFLFIVDEVDYSYGFARWTGAAWSWDTPSSTVQVREAGGTVLISVNASELGGSQSFNFSAATRTGTDGQFDDAPDEGHYNYTLSAGGPDIRSVRVEAKPVSGPKAGGVFTVSPVSVELPPNGGLLAPTPAPESYSCAARLGAKTLVGTGTGRCTFKIPKKKSKNKTLTVSVTASYQGATKTVSFAYKVR
jgi:hypothetical protein